MPASFNLPRPVAAAFLVALGLGLSAVARAEQHAAAASPAASAPDAAASGGTGGSQGGAVAWPDSPARIKSARASPGARGPRDAMEMLRERLAQKLGAVRAPDTDNPNVVRVIAKTGPRPSNAMPSGAVPSGAIPLSAMPPGAVLSGTMSPGSVPSGTRRPSGTLSSSAYPPDMRVAATAVGSASRRAAASDAAAQRDLPRPAVTGQRGGGAAVNAHGTSADWAYDGNAGPQAWAELSRDFSTCATGSRQSPIDIRDGIKVELDAVRFDYKPGGFRVLDNGHTVQVNVAPGSSIEVLGRHYDLVQFDFHRPSEERIDGKQFDMAVHLVHKDLDGRLAVVAVLLERGSAQPLVQSVWNNLPLEKGDEVVARVALDPNDLLPHGRGYYTYMGSLTTPPCSEGVLWMVMKEPVQLSPEQIGIFARLYPMNARPVQSAAGRLIKESN